VKSHVNLISRFDEFVGKTGPAARAKNEPRLPKGGVDLLVPPALVPEFHGVAARWIELAHDRIQARLGVAGAWRQLEKKASHPLTEDVGDHAEVPNERFRALELLDVGDELANLHGVNEISAARLAAPGLNAGDSRP
jgi:hypothetical protein